MVGFFHGGNVLCNLHDHDNYEDQGLDHDQYDNDDSVENNHLQSMCACVELTKTVLPSEIGGGVAQPWIIIIIIIIQHCITKIIIVSSSSLSMSPTLAARSSPVAHIGEEPPS